MLLQPLTPLIYEVVEPTTRETTVSDVLLGSAAMIGAVSGVALLLGCMCAGCLIGVRRLRGRNKLAEEGNGGVRLKLNG